MNKVTIITTCYNDAANIKKYLINICSQTMQPQEIIIVDGGSKDNTIELIEEYKSNNPSIPIRIIQDGRLNIAQGFNLGIKNADTELVCLTCIGNNFTNDMLMKLCEGIESGDYDACYGRMIGIDKGKFSHMYNKCFIGGSEGLPTMSNRCVLYNKRTFEITGFFLENFFYAGEDAEFLKTFKDKGLVAKSIDDILVAWETPKNKKEYLKQLKFYSIADLQYQPILSQFLNKESLLLLIVLILICCTYFFRYGIFVALFLLLLRILYTIISKKLSFTYSIFYISREYIKLYYKFKYIKFCSPTNRVIREKKK